jgi:multidrug resistance efflux pump
LIQISGLVKKCLIAVAILALMGLGGWLYNQADSLEAESAMRSINLPADLPGETIEVSGIIEAEQVLVTPELGGRILRISTDEGDDVKADQEVAWLDQDLLASEIKKAEAAVALAEAQLAQVKTGAKPEDISMAEASLEIALAARSGAKSAWDDSRAIRDDPQQLDSRIDIARTQLSEAEGALQQATAQVEANSAERQTNKELLDTLSSELRFTVQTPYGPQVVKYKPKESMREPFHFEYDMSTYDWWDAWVTAEQAKVAKEGAELALDNLLTMREHPIEADAMVNRSLAAYQQAEADVAHAQAQLEMIENGATPELIAVAEADASRARAALSSLVVQSRKMTLRSPIDGLVTELLANEGELAIPGVALMKVADLDSLKLTVYIPEDQLGWIQVGQPVEVTVDSFSRKTFSGTITYISPQAEFTPKNVQTKEERLNTVFATEIQIFNLQHELKPGMPADALIEVPS